MSPSYFEYYFVHPKTKSTSQAQIKLEIFVNFRPKPGPNSVRTRSEKPGPTYNSALPVPNHLQNVTSKCKILNVFWTYIASKKRSEQFNFYNWLSNVKISFFQMALNTCEMWPSGVKIAFFPKNYKKLFCGWGFRPQTPIASCGLGLRPQTPSVIRLSYVSLLNTSTILDIFAFWLFYLSPLLLANTG